MSTSFGTIFRILLIQFAVVGMTSRLQFITYFIIQIILMKGGHSWTTFKVLEKIFQIMMHQIHVFWMLPFNTYWLLKIWCPSYLLLSHLNNSHFSIHMLTLLSPAIVHTRFNDKWLFVSFFFYCHHCFSLVFYYLVLFFIKWLNSDF